MHRRDLYAGDGIGLSEHSLQARYSVVRNCDIISVHACFIESLGEGVAWVPNPFADHTFIC
jgi:hypothetical protein